MKKNKKVLLIFALMLSSLLITGCTDKSYNQCLETKALDFCKDKDCEVEDIVVSPLFGTNFYILEGEYREFKSISFTKKEIEGCKKI